MRNLIKLFLLSLSVATASGAAFAQTASAPAPIKHYKVDFVVKEIDAGGKIVNSRSFSTILATNNAGKTDQIRSGTKVPILAGLDEKGDSKYQYVDIGVNIDCSFIQEIDQKLAMSVKAEISSIPAATSSNSGLGPVVRQFQWNSDIAISPAVPTTVFSSDDVSSKGGMQVEVTATLIK